MILGWRRSGKAGGRQIKNAFNENDVWIWFISGPCVRVPYIWTADKTADVYIENFIQKDI